VRLYDVAVASLAAQAPGKWTDNLLSQHVIPEVAHRRRGVPRGISWPALVRIGLIRSLHVRFGCGVREAVALAAELLDDPASDSLRVGWVAISLDRDALERDLRVRLEDALESAPRPRRGRPASKRVRLTVRGESNGSIVGD
jgi:hypothetical protein